MTEMQTMLLFETKLFSNSRLMLFHLANEVKCVTGMLVMLLFELISLCQQLPNAVSLRKRFSNSTGSAAHRPPTHTACACRRLHLPCSTQPWHRGQNHSSASQSLSGSNPQGLHPPLRCQHHTRQMSSPCQQVG